MPRPHITLGQIRERAAPKSFARGQDLYFKHAVFDTTLRGEVIEGRCEASSQPDPYDTQVTFDRDGIVDASCTCLYEFGGDCKHVVALLLTYLNTPDRFEVRQPLADVLEKRDKSELIALIRQMVKRYPDLKNLVDRPTPGKVTSEAPLDLNPFRKELHRAYGREREWGRPGAETAVESVRAAALEFAEQNDWRSASSLYRLIIEECLAHLDYFYEDEEGWYGEAIDNVIAELDVCLDSLADDDHERQAILNSLMDFYLTDIETGGDVGADSPDIILRHARPVDIPSLQTRLKAGIKEIENKPYSEWAVKSYNQFLVELDLLNSADPEAILTRLRNEKMYDLLIAKLLELKRGDEAVAVIREHMTHPHERMIQLPRLYMVGYQDEAIELAEEVLRKTHDCLLIDWLIDMLESRGDSEVSLRWQLKRMKTEPGIGHYNLLKETSLKLGNWVSVRPTIVEQLEMSQKYAVLTRVYLADEDWDKAWATLPKAANTPETSIYGRDYRLPIDVAKATLQTHPEKALPIFIHAARAAIDQRSRDSYREAANYLVTVRDTYDSMDEFEVWEKLINGIKGGTPRLPALLDELKKAGL